MIDKPSIKSELDQIVVCEQQTLELQATETENLSNTSFVWKNPKGNIISTNSTGKITFEDIGIKQSGVYKVYGIHAECQTEVNSVDIQVLEYSDETIQAMDNTLTCLDTLKLEASDPKKGLENGSF